MASSAVLTLPPGVPSSPSNRIDSLDEWLAGLTQPTALTELAAVAVCVLVAWLVVRTLSRLRAVKDARSVWFGERIVDGVLFPALLLGFAYAAQALVAPYLPLAVFKVAIPIFLALAMIRLGVKVLQVAFKNAPLVRVLERTISWLVWIGLVLWLSGLLPVVLEEFDKVEWRVGDLTLSLRTILEGTVTAGVVLLISLWISAAIETRLLRSATGGELSVRKAVANAMRVVLMFIGLLLALSAVGIDLTALSVFGGAIGVGVGFGLQKLAASYVSGFVMLAERSVRIGDTVKVDIFEGVITDIRARYSVVRTVSGREAIVPNETFIGNRVENLSQADLRLAQAIVLTVAYDSDVDLVLRLLRDAVASHERTLRDPAPEVNLTAFGTYGLEFTINYSMLDTDNGQQRLRSAVNLSVLRSLREHGIEIPYPQQVVRNLAGPATAAENPRDRADMPALPDPKER